MAFLSEMWSLEKAAGVWERGRCVTDKANPPAVLSSACAGSTYAHSTFGGLRSKNADANSLEGGGSLDSIAKVEKILEWCDAHLEEGSFFKDWAPCDHPQLGPVEIGGESTLQHGCVQLCCTHC